MILPFSFAFHATPQTPLDVNKPSGLMVDFISVPDQVFKNGYAVNTPLYYATTLRERFQYVEIARRQPFFCWIVNSSQNNTIQMAYQIVVASSIQNIEANIGDYWDSGKVPGDRSTNVLYNGKALKPDSVYFWKVKTWDNHGVESSFSSIQQFKTAPTLSDYATTRYPIRKQDVYPTSIKSAGDSAWFIDFGKAAFGTLHFTLLGKTAGDTVVIHLGEALSNGRINRNPGGTIRYARYIVKLLPGWNTYQLVIAPDKRNTGPQAIRMPDYIGEVFPFRYCEIENYKEPLSENQFVQETAFYPFNDDESFFYSSDSVLNQVWNLCKYSIKATSFAGTYVDGDRERIPYEADAYINQLGHYGVAREYSIGRYSHEYLITHPTWPTEWILQSVLMAWNDYMYTGNKASLRHFYNDLKAKALLPLAGDD
ncbi:MAG TPA: family 78 glycoside hydrolase catalytic domain, partial [Bacteroidales bacterium]|nr:family 78 glycoside hydrolase catalytic domain [Bacteroidales bacterium]